MFLTRHRCGWKWNILYFFFFKCGVTVMLPHSSAGHLLNSTYTGSKWELRASTQRCYVVSVTVRGRSPVGRLFSAWVSRGFPVKKENPGPSSGNEALLHNTCLDYSKTTPWEGPNQWQYVCLGPSSLSSVGSNRNALRDWQWGAETFMVGEDEMQLWSFIPKWDSHTSDTWSY